MSLQGPPPEHFGSSDETKAQLRRFGPPAVIGLLGLIFILQNLDTISVDFLWFSFKAQLWLLLVIFACIGALVFWGIQRRRAARKARAAPE
jgi:uncharacterized integral membrane protein